MILITIDGFKTVQGLSGGVVSLPLLDECVWQGEEIEHCKTCGSGGRHVYECLHPGQDPTAKIAGRCTRGDVRPDTWACNRCADYQPYD
jgi:hypothetical protein